MHWHMSHLWEKNVLQVGSCVCVSCGAGPRKSHKRVSIAWRELNSHTSRCSNQVSIGRSTVELSGAFVVCVRESFQGSELSCNSPAFGTRFQRPAPSWGYIC